MYKNQLQELAQRSCFNLPSYACIREGPDHAPRFKATVNFNGEIFESPSFCTTLRQAEHAAAEVALNTLSSRGPSRSLAAKVLDETGVYKNLLQETAHRAGLKLPLYTTVRSGPGHIPVFSCTVELAGMSFTGEPAKTKKQAQKNAAMAAWSALKQLPHLGSSSSSSSSTLLGPESNDEQEQVTIARALASLQPKEGNKPSAPNDPKRGRRKPPPIRRDMNASSDLSMYSMSYQAWPYSSFPHEVAVYQMWQQEQASQRQSHLLSLAALPSPGAQIAPYIQSVFRPSHSQYFAAREQELLVPGVTVSNPGPSLYFSNHPLPVSISSRSHVTIQEIQEEKSQGEEEWSDSCRTNLQPRRTSFALHEVQNPPVDSRIEPEVKESQMDKSNNGGSSIANILTDKETNIRHSKSGSSDSSPSTLYNGGDSKDIREVPIEGNRMEQFDWVRGRSMHDGKEAGFVARTPVPSNVPFQSQNPHVLYSSRANPTHYHPPSLNSSMTIRGFRSRTSSLAAPVTIRSAVPVCSARPASVNSRPSPDNRVAPAVQIRSVIPVCSAPPPPPPRNLPDSRNEGLLSSAEVKTQDPEDIAAVNSELGKLRI